jgi:hypothetical protein
VGLLGSPRRTSTCAAGRVGIDLTLKAVVGTR